eukprot:scaffold34921_cov162-Amphora_coffeaeformis.AAC.1
MGYQGSLQIVYDYAGTGKSSALQIVARAKSAMQPCRFLVINLPVPQPSQLLYEEIKKQVLGSVQDFDFSPEEIAGVVKHGLCGQIAQETESLPTTRNKCRLSIDAPCRYFQKSKNCPILVIDEFNPSDFKWAKDYTRKEIEDELGDAFRFFKMLTGLAYTSDGFVVFVGTRVEAFARALHKINGGTKAQLARCTIIPGTRHDKYGNFPFGAWRGFVWSPADKAKVVRSLFGKSYKDALRRQGTPRDEAETQKEIIIMNLCSRDDNIRGLCHDMQQAVKAKNGETGVFLQNSTQFSQSGGCCATNFVDDAKANAANCSTMYCDACEMCHRDCLVTSECNFFTDKQAYRDWSRQGSAVEICFVHGYLLLQSGADHRPF